MEDYLKNMKSLRVQINDVEDQAAKISVEEQTQIIIIHNLEKDLNSANSMTRKISDDADLMLKTTVDIRDKILEKQKRISSLESDYFSLAQTLELVQQERISLSAKLLEKRMYYSELGDEMNSKLLQKQKDEMAAGLVICPATRESNIIDAIDMENKEAKERSIGEGHEHSLEEVGKQKLKRELDTTKAKLEKIIDAKHELVSENSKINHSIEQVKCQVNDLRLQLESKGIDMISLKDEHKALSSDKNGEKEYMQTLQLQIERLKGISHVTRCTCGQEYKVEAKPCV